MIDALSSILGAGSKYPGEKVEIVSPLECDGSVWERYHVVRKATNTKALLFYFSKKNKLNKALAENEFKKLRGLRHPSILNFLNGIEKDSSIEFITENCAPLSYKVLSMQSFDIILWGISKITSGLEFLHDSCQISHNCVRLQSVYVMDSGEWKLGDFSWALKTKDKIPISQLKGNSLKDYSLKGNSLTPLNVPIPPEGFNSENFPLYAADIWCFGKLLEDILNYLSTRFSSKQEAQICTEILELLNKSLLRKNAFHRSSIKEFRKICLQKFFRSKFIDTMDNLETISFKSKDEAAKIFQSVQELLLHLPSELKKYKILPLLLNTTEFTELSIKLITPILSIFEDLSEEEFNSYSKKGLLKLFSSKQLDVQIMLLDQISLIASKLPKKYFSTDVFNSISRLFADPSPQLRNKAVVAVASYAKHLTPEALEKIKDIMLYILNKDSEETIRTNAVVCLAKTMDLFPESVQRYICSTSFTHYLIDQSEKVRYTLMCSISKHISVLTCKELVLIIQKTALCALDTPMIRNKYFSSMPQILSLLQEKSASLNNLNGEYPDKGSYNTQHKGSYITQHKESHLSNSTTPQHKESYITQHKDPYTSNSTTSPLAKLSAQKSPKSPTKSNSAEYKVSCSPNAWKFQSQSSSEFKGYSNEFKRSSNQSVSSSESKRSSNQSSGSSMGSFLKWD